jgi:pimeloyl-ACP methyl ester carboxylesterase
MILLHGANSGGVELAPLAEALRPYATVRTPNLLGHGGRPIPARITLRDMAEDLVAWMDAEGIDTDVIGGYSIGGTLALYVARHYPQRVRGAIALATKHVFDAATTRHLIHLVNHERLERIRFPWGMRIDELARIHAPNTWQDAADMTGRLFASLGQSPPLPEAELRAIRVPVMVVSSNLDQLVPWDETLALGRFIPGSHVAMFHGPAHPLRAIPLLPVARTMDEWMGHKGLRG